MKSSTDSTIFKFMFKFDVIIKNNMPVFTQTTTHIFDLSIPNCINNIRNQIQFESGIYYWFADEVLLRLLGIPNNNSLYSINRNGKSFFLLYIGIGPRDANTTKQFIKDRITKCHLGEKITNSTLRLSLSSMINKQFYKRVSGSKNKIKFYLLNKDEKHLTNIMMSHMLVSVYRHTAPWTVEQNLIQTHQPPINITHNTNGWFYSTIKSIRNTAQLNAI